MTEHDDKPKRTSSSTIQAIQASIPPNWKLALLVVLTIGGGGSVLGYQIKPASEQTAIEAHENGPAHTEIKEELEEQGAKIESNSTSIEKISTQLDQVQDTQRSSYARQEARQVTDGIKNRRDRERAYDRIVRFNLSRLERGMEPCGNVDCSN